MNSGIYYIKNKINGQTYIGQSQNLNRRVSEPHTGCVYLVRAMEKYGKENFERRVVETCPLDKLDEREIYWIKSLKTHVSEGGYNVSWGGNAPMRGLKHSKEAKKKMSMMRVGRKNVNYGRDISGEYGHKISKTRIERGIGKGENNPRFGTKLPSAKSQFYGVTYRLCKRKYGYWTARIYVNSKRIFVGQYKTELEAAHSYDEYILRNNLSHPLNFPNQDN